PATAPAEPADVAATTPMMALDLPPISMSSEPAAEPTPEPEATPPPPAKPTTHTVEEGETLRMLAARFGISPDTIMAANGLRDPDLLKVGQDLLILPTDGVLYTLKDGESIRRVAERFGIETIDIVKANDLGDP